MNNIWFTSDTHFCHDRGFIYEPRGFKTVEEMNEAIVERWNSVVQSNDIVYHLGDVMLNNNKKGLEYLSQLNGKIIIICGNHDTDARKESYFYAPNVDFYNSMKYADIIKYEKYHFYISHYPTNTSNLESDMPLHKYLINLYGHTHQTTNFYNDIPYMYHVGMDSHNCYPVNVEEILKDIKNKVKECKEML